MSRSKRKVPVAGITTARTEKDYKTSAHRSERRTARTKIKGGRPDDIPHPKAFGNPWSGPKDGKCWFDKDSKAVRK